MLISINKAPPIIVGRRQITNRPHTCLLRAWLWCRTDKFKCIVYGIEKVHLWTSIKTTWNLYRCDYFRSVFLLKDKCQDHKLTISVLLRDTNGKWQKVPFFINSKPFNNVASHSWFQNVLYCRIRILKRHTVDDVFEKVKNYY